MLIGYARVSTPVLFASIECAEGVAPGAWPRLDALCKRRLPAEGRSSHERH
jgi:hypothetical protein